LDGIFDGDASCVVDTVGNEDDDFLFGLCKIKRLDALGDGISDGGIFACDFDLKDNYFAWQAFNRGYGDGPSAPLPPYLQREHYEEIVERVDRIEVRHINFTDYLRSREDASLDRYILLDAQDWMTDEQLTDLWTEITRTAKPGARVLFRTAGTATILPGRVPDAVLGRWDYRAEDSLDYTRRDRSSIYGGVHLYVLGDAA